MVHELGVRVGVPQGITVSLYHREPSNCGAVPALHPEGNESINILMIWRGVTLLFDKESCQVSCTYQSDWVSFHFCELTSVSH